ncbi:MAG: twitching motility protein PilT [Herpetosiphonaceae bacterium]|nr:twitching motility protein PilT [Herpetosiphonaceae bacterium]
MRFTANFYTRITGALVLAYAGYRFGTLHSATPPTDTQHWATSLLVLCGAGMGLVLTHYLTLYPFRRLKRRVQTMTAIELMTTTLGLVGGLLIGVLLTIPLSHLPWIFGVYLPIIAAILAAYLGLVAASARKDDLEALLMPKRAMAHGQRTLLDTSVIIDGRIVDVIHTGFIYGTLVVPRFVLQEVQQLADSHDDLTRAKGKRGLDMLQALQADPAITVEISDLDLPMVHEVDDKLLALARSEGVGLLTNDGNLERVGTLQKLRILNLNALADAVRTPFLTGDQLRITIRSEGREREQGVGFLHDGTMVVVEDARHLVGKELPVVVTRLYTTQTGRIVFAQIAGAGRGLNSKQLSEG